MDILWQHITQIAAVVTILATATYVLGLIALSWPVYWGITNDASTALYTVSLVPRMVVAGQGLIIFVGYPLITALFIIVSVPLLTPEVINAALSYWELPMPPTWLSRIILALISTVIALFYLKFIERLRSLLDFLFPPPARSGAPSFRWKSIVLSSVGGAIGAWWITARIHGGEISRSAFLEALMIIFAINAVAGAPEAVSIDPPFPTANLTVKENEEEENEEKLITYEGKLLAHSEGHWYFFDNQTHKLMVVPHDKAEVVCAPREAC